MGYTTEFVGSVSVNPPLTPAQVRSIHQFSEERHDGDPTCPGIHCDWIASDDGTRIYWNGNEKFYDAEEWMRVVISKFYPNQRVNGQIEAQGEDYSDRWLLVVENNVVSRRSGRVVYD